MKNSQMKIMFMFLFFLLATAMPLFAQIVPSGLQTAADQIQEAFTGPLVTVILVCCLAGCGIAYAFNKDNDKMKRNIIAVGIGIIIIGAAVKIVGTVMAAGKSG